MRQGGSWVYIIKGLRCVLLVFRQCTYSISSCSLWRGREAQRHIKSSCLLHYKAWTEHTWVAQVTQQNITHTFAPEKGKQCLCVCKTTEAILECCCWMKNYTSPQTYVYFNVFVMTAKMNRHFLIVYFIVWKSVCLLKNVHQVSTKQLCFCTKMQL